MTTDIELTPDTDRTLIRSRIVPATAPPKVAPREAKSGATHSSWSNPNGWTGQGGPPPAAGTVIKKRFILEQPIGQGGMGTVFRARDLRKEEARDRNPYVAIKVLNEDFKRHPGALQALHREAQKSQKLAHPNIVTVFDFDRDGNTVYMVMELLEGEPLDRLIKRKQDVGLGVRDSVLIMAGICRALEYAHDQGILHADFKPANAFVTTSGVVKVLDFGIARAVNVKDSTEEEGLTRFDPGTLGALTPAYSGCEVIEGEAPDPRDDIYAIACVTYELITGSHPFNRLSASQAEKAHMTADPPPGMSARQWRALRRGLSFRRAGRQSSARALMDGLRPFGSPALYAAMGTIAVVALALMSVPIFGQIEKFRERNLIAALASADAARIDPKLNALKTLQPARRASLFLHDDARAGLIEYYTNRVNGLVDAAKGRFDYPAAQSLLHELEEFFPDSAAVRILRDRLASKRSAALAHLSAAFNLDLQRKWLIPAQNADCVIQVLTVARQVDPMSPLLSDPRLPGAFAEGVSRALRQSQLTLADALVTAGLTIVPRDAVLADLHDQVQRETRNQSQSALQAAAASRQREDSAAQWRSQLEEGMKRPILTLAQARTLLHLSDELQRHGESGATAMRRKLETRLLRSIAAIESKEGLDAAVTFTKDVCAMLPESSELARTLAQLQSAVAQRAATLRAGAIATAESETEVLLAHATLDEAWDDTLRRQLAKLAGFEPETESYLVELKARTAAMYVSQAAKLRSAKQLDEAARMLERSREYVSHPTDASVEEEALLADARAKQAIGTRKSDRAAYVNSLEKKLMTQAGANDVASAEMTLRMLRENLAANDRFLMREGPVAVAQAYGRMARKAVEAGQLKIAVELISRGRAAAPSLDTLAAIQARYARYQVLDDYLTGGTVPDVHQVRREISDLYAQDSNTARVMVPILARDLASRLRTTDDPQLAARLSQAGTAIFGDGPPFQRD